MKTAEQYEYDYEHRPDEQSGADFFQQVMDEWGRQCWTEAKKKRPQLDENGYWINYTYDDYLKELEATNDKTGN